MWNKIETSAVSDMRKFFDKQNTPKGVLSKLPWKLVDNCSKADAVVSLKFETSFEVTQASGSGMATAAAITQSVPKRPTPPTCWLRAEPPRSRFTR